MSLLKLPVLLSSMILYDIALDRHPPLHPDANSGVYFPRANVEIRWPTQYTVPQGSSRHRATYRPQMLTFPSRALLACSTAVVETIATLCQLRDAGSSDSAESDAMSVLLNALCGRRPNGRSFCHRALLVNGGGIACFRCFQRLGPYFTFVQCIHKDHRLIMTGPYAVVRHPGHTGLFC